MQRIRIFIAQIEQFVQDAELTAHEAWELSLLIHKLKAKLTEQQHEQPNNGEQ